MNKLLLTFLIGTSLTLTAPAFAHEGEEHEGIVKEQGVSTQESVSTVNAMARIESDYAALSEAAINGQYDKIHESSEKIEASLQALANAHKGDTAITETVTQLGKALSALHSAGDAKDAAKVGTQLKKLEGGIKLLNVRTKK